MQAEEDWQNEPIAIPIEDVLDLHSVPDRDAKAVVEAYLDAALEAGLEAVRIIHGRGIGARREMVRKVLSCQSFVVSFSDAPPEAGGWGATIATISHGPTSNPYRWGRHSACPDPRPTIKTKLNPRPKCP